VEGRFVGAESLCCRPLSRFLMVWRREYSAVVPVLAIADLTQGFGRFNLTLWAISTAVGVGASLSQVIASAMVRHFGYNAGLLFLASVAAVALAILYFFMPETRDKQFLNPNQGAATP
jgi:cyanate permease